MGCEYILFITSDICVKVILKVSKSTEAVFFFELHSLEFTTIAQNLMIVLLIMNFLQKPATLDLQIVETAMD